ncbi:MAG: sigma-70 family RNA polymerase sigma factor [Thermodesulfobacteriota bacterium]|nr:sigma-70 family RNA polymerase sigma factor [Thermodesulfobacteriota bacterium]
MELSLLIACLVVISTVTSTGGKSVASVKKQQKDETTKLVQDFCNGDSQAFNKLVLLFQNRMFSLAYNYVKNPEEAKDLAQDIFITVHRALPTLRDKTKFSAWIYQIGINHCRNRYKKLQRQGYFTSQSIDNPDHPVHLTGTDSPEKELERQDLIRVVRSTIAEMKEGEKEIILLRDIQDLSYEEISQILDVPIGTVKSKLNRARLSLKNRLKAIRPNL